MLHTSETSHALKRLCYSGDTLKLDAFPVSVSVFITFLAIVQHTNNPVNLQDRIASIEMLTVLFSVSNI